MIEDVDAPTRSPFVHCVALLDPEVGAVPAGALGADSTAQGVRVLRSGMGRGHLGPEPIKGHGDHRYVFQLFALAAAVTSADGGADRGRPRTVLAGVGGPTLARGRLDGRYSR